jgi:hypothetical protein
MGKMSELAIKVDNEINSGGEAETKIRKFERLIVNQIPFLDKAPYSHNIISLGLRGIDEIEKGRAKKTIRKFGLDKLGW